MQNNEVHVVLFRGALNGTEGHRFIQSYSKHRRFFKLRLSRVSSEVWWVKNGDLLVGIMLQESL